MSLEAHTMTAPRKGARKKKRVGRGNASGKGNYSARGMKGQRSRSGGKSGTARRGFKAQLQKMPKLRGFKSGQAKPTTVTLASLERVGIEGTDVTPRFLEACGLTNRPQDGIKIVATGELKKKLTIKGCVASKTAMEMIEKAGGKMVF